MFYNKYEAKIAKFFDFDTYFFIQIVQKGKTNRPSALQRRDSLFGSYIVCFVPLSQIRG